jgi:hypothetical protein
VHVVVDHLRFGDPVADPNVEAARDAEQLVVDEARSRLESRRSTRRI